MTSCAGAGSMRLYWTACVRWVTVHYVTSAHGEIANGTFLRTNPYCSAAHNCIQPVGGLAIVLLPKVYVKHF